MRNTTRANSGSKAQGKAASTKARTRAKASATKAPGKGAAKPAAKAKAKPETAAPALKDAAKTPATATETAKTTAAPATEPTPPTKPDTANDPAPPPGSGDMTAEQRDYLEAFRETFVGLGFELSEVGDRDHGEVVADFQLAIIGQGQDKIVQIADALFAGMKELDGETFRELLQFLYNEPASAGAQWMKLCGDEKTPAFFTKGRWTRCEAAYATAGMEVIAQAFRAHNGAIRQLARETARRAGKVGVRPILGRRSDRRRAAPFTPGSGLKRTR